MTQPNPAAYAEGMQRMNANQAQTITELRSELRDAQAGNTPVNPEDGDPETWRQAVMRLEGRLAERDEQILRERTQSTSERAALADRLDAVHAELAETRGERDGLLGQHEADGVRIESLVGELGRTRHQRDEAVQETLDLCGEVEEYRRHVRDVLIRVATANHWADDEVLSSILDELGLDRIEQEYVVPVEVTVHQHVKVTVRATSPAQAARQAEQHETIDRLMTWKPEDFDGWTLSANEDAIQGQGGWH